MKIAILTFQDAINYGAALQAFALKNAISVFEECQVINYYNDYFHRDDKKRDIKSIIFTFLNKRDYEKKKQRFTQFQNKYIVDNTTPVKVAGLNELNDQYDLFITGSDQVWNMQCSGNNTTYFLDFVADAHKKYSYAASFGGDNVSDEISVAKLLQSFQKISVREKSGQELIEKLTGKQAQVVLDPTLLLKKEQWKSTFDLNFDSRYVLVYEVLNGTNLFEEAKQFARDRNLPLVCITSSNKPKIGCRCVKDAGPIEWLKLLSESAYVFTNSFHGLAFSLIFEKQFFIELLPPPANTNARLVELLSMVSLSDRIIQREKNLKDFPSVDYTLIDKKLEAMREESFTYIKSMLKGI